MEYLANNWLELIGLGTGLLCVVLMIKQNVLTFPIGAVYAVVTVVVVANSFLYADVVLNLYYVGMNLYGWYFWLRGGGDRRQTDVLMPGWVPRRQWWLIAPITVAGTLAMGAYFANFTQADLAYPDSFTTIASFVAMWMSARKYLESWIAWFVIDVVQVGLYLYKDIPEYALLYLVYLGLAIWGWRSWRSAVPGDPAHAQHAPS